MSCSCGLRAGPRTPAPHSAPAAMSTQGATAQAQEPGGRTKSSSPRQIPVVRVVTEDEDAQVRAGGCALEGVEGAGGDLGAATRPRQQGPKWPRWKHAEPAGPSFRAPQSRSLRELRLLQAGLAVVSHPVWRRAARSSQSVSRADQAKLCNSFSKSVPPRGLGKEQFLAKTGI